MSGLKQFYATIICCAWLSVSARASLVEMIQPIADQPAAKIGETSTPQNPIAQVKTIDWQDISLEPPALNIGLHTPLPRVDSMSDSSAAPAAVPLPPAFEAGGVCLLGLAAARLAIYLHRRRI